MVNQKDMKAIENQIELLKNNNQKTLEYLSALELLLVDDNNSKSKDVVLSKELDYLHSKVNSLSKDIDTFMNTLSDI
ncbi:hypothetical protein [Alkaliphilus serpentinus]|uniref:Uncharacterized protein n=1 Tax=Alkaliphilus serpentinus TaxID=1482731 RepID=A0A833HMT8_9FIRM|nr:hypothetical protein [Alkaliphilus serpentinus]KAB3528854.1 hypothetical protein F8153_11060 [Alkaliphilus serpentinus]